MPKSPPHPASRRIILHAGILYADMPYHRPHIFEMTAGKDSKPQANDGALLHFCLLLGCFLVNILNFVFFLVAGWPFKLFSFVIEAYLALS